MILMEVKYAAANWKKSRMFCASQKVKNKKFFQAEIDIFKEVLSLNPKVIFL